MAAKKEIAEHLKIALQEIGKIKPWFDREVGEWIFSHSLYPVEYGGNSRAEVVENYPKYLREFIRHRLNNKLASVVKEKTKGRGGKRIGAGRPKGTRKTPPTTTVRLDKMVADWVKKHQEEILSLISGKKILTSPKKHRRLRGFL